MESSPHSSSGETLNAPGQVYSIEMVEQITHITRDQIVQYHRWGLIRTTRAMPVAVENEMVFDDEAIHRLRRIAFLLAEYQVNPGGLRQLTALIDEVESLREEVRFLRLR